MKRVRILCPFICTICGQWTQLTAMNSSVLSCLARAAAWSQGEPYWLFCGYTEGCLVPGVVQTATNQDPSGHSPTAEEPEVGRRVLTTSTHRSAEFSTTLMRQIQDDSFRPDLGQWSLNTGAVHWVCCWQSCREGGVMLWQSMWSAGQTLADNTRSCQHNALSQLSTELSH